MKKLIAGLALVLVSLSAQAKDRLEVYTDYDIGKEIITVTTVKVDANMGDVYLAGLKESWVKAVTIQKEMGYIKNYRIFASELPQSGDFNMLLVVYFDSAADLEPNQERYQAFMKKWGEANQKRSQEISAKYPEVRTLTGEYRFREIIMK
ncbi:hypothetical protein [Paraferrimonas sedimenticola]|uniref:NIPSNAP protein n=1 Tax=Paraferrimonas sedimenticola TaxID=375674 RepID=A0AA37W0S6_9GAMM|nr:hypothetical protein [Paraferrimonas sedimenticola]GLP95487.1 hypothetical protein GCM10007895_07930 [Paraferrimonas sedimenticola]